MGSIVGTLVLAAQEVSNKKDIYPHWSELIVGAIAFFILFAFMWKFVMPRINKILETRRQKIQGDLEAAEQSRSEAGKLLEDYRQQLSGARGDANRIIDEARKTAETMRKGMEQRAQEEARAIVDRAQEEIRAERDRVFQELKAQVGELSLALAGRMVGESLDRDRHLRLVDDYIRDLERMPAGGGNGHSGGSGSGSGEGGGGA